MSVEPHEDPPALPLAPGEEPWQRLDPRMMLVYPLRELVRFLPVLLGLFIAGSASGGMELRWQVVGIGVPVAVGLLRYLTTAFRIHQGRVELRRGLLDRHLLSARLDRVRTVDLTATPVQRVLGLATVRIGTGTASTSEEAQIDLDGLPGEVARRLRQDLLAGLRSPAPDTERERAADDLPADRTVLVLDPSWARFAPLTSTGLVLVAGVLGVGSQVLEGIGRGVPLDPDRLTDLSLLAVVPAALVGLAVAVSVLAVGGYLVTNWGFTLSRRPSDGSWHLRRGLLTTRETSVDADRVAGVSVGEPLGLRLAGGARLSAIVTGLDRKESGSAVLVPPAPRLVVTGVASEVLGTTGPLSGPLVPHGRRAAVRRWTRALVPTTLASVGLALLVAAGAWSWLLVPALLAPAVAAALAVDRVRSLGHALTEGYVVSRAGSLGRRREALAVDDVIGWTFRSSWFQRRAGLTTLVATTAGGRQSVTLLDVPEPGAVSLATAAVPGLVDQFTR